MGFSDNLRKFKQRIIDMGDSIKDMTEEATKNALVMPFFSLLGYDVFNPQEFVPELTCDVGTKKGEKIDYAIFRDGEPIILVEAKRCGMKLQKQQQNQLYRYFSVNHARIAILTNGIQYNIFSDINSPNVMDDEPFLSFNLMEDDENVYLAAIEMFTSEKFNAKDILSKAVYMKYSALVERIFRKDLENPSDELVKYFLMRPEIKTGARITSNTINQFRESTAATLRKVMGVTIHTVSDSEVIIQDEEEPKANEPIQETKNEYPEKIIPLLDALSEIGTDMEKVSYAYVSDIHIISLDKECDIRIPNHKFDHMVIKYPNGNMRFVSNIEKLKNQLTVTCK